MPDIYFKCSCRKSLAVRDASVGKVFNCPDCGNPVEVPAPEMEIHCACCDNAMLLPRSMAGEEVQCTDCKYNMVVPEPSPEQLVGSRNGVPADDGLDESSPFKKVFIGLTTLLLCLLGIWILVEMGADQTDTEEEPAARVPAEQTFDAPASGEPVPAAPGEVHPEAGREPPRGGVKSEVPPPSTGQGTPGRVAQDKVDEDKTSLADSPLQTSTAALSPPVQSPAESILFLDELPADIRSIGGVYCAKLGELESQRQALLDRINAIYLQCLGQLEEQFKSENRGSDLALLRDERDRFNNAMTVGAEDIQTSISGLEKFQVMYCQSLISGPVLKILQDIVTLTDSYVGALDAAERKLMADDNAGAALAVRGERNKALGNPLQAEARSIVGRVAVAAPPAPGPVPSSSVQIESQPSQGAVATNNLSLVVNWNRSMTSSKSVKDDLLSILLPFGEANTDFDRHDDIKIFENMTYLMDVAEAHKMLNERSGSSKSVGTPYFANGSFRYYTINKDVADGGMLFNRILLVTDNANQLVAVQFVKENSNNRQLNFGNESECSMYNIIQQKKKSGANTRIQYGVAFVGANRRMGWGQDFRSDVLCIESECLQRSGYYDVKSVEFVRLYLPVPIVNLLLHCLETQR